jgi:hypothetical protein
MDVPVSSPRKNALSSGHAETRRYGLSRFYYGERYAGGKADGHFILAWKLPHLNKL